MGNFKTVVPIAVSLVIAFVGSYFIYMWIQKQQAPQQVVQVQAEAVPVVVAVSEESGAISYAYKGQLVRGVSLEELRAFLTTTLIHTVKARGMVVWLRSWFGERPKPGPAVVMRAETPGGTPVSGK